ncbi:hypothetical protein MMC10_003561 [Thelotrema lepadinum]|nr:hypothetical protein [Thelotrema lepadinum]
MLRVMLDTLQANSPVDPDLLISAFEVASFQQDFETIRELLKVKIARNHFDFGAALYWSSLRRNEELTELLLSNGAIPNRIDPSALGKFVNIDEVSSRRDTGTMSLVRYLAGDENGIGAESDFTAATAQMWSLVKDLDPNGPLFIAILMNADNIIDIFLRHGAQINQGCARMDHGLMAINGIDFISPPEKSSQKVFKSFRKEHIIFSLGSRSKLPADDIKDKLLLRGTMPTGCPPLDWVIKHLDSTTEHVIDVLRNYGAAPHLPDEFWLVLKQWRFRHSNLLQQALEKLTYTYSPRPCKPSLFLEGYICGRAYGVPSRKHQL